MVKDVICTFWFATGRELAASDDTDLGEINLLANLIHQVPLVVGCESRCDELRADVPFAEGLFVYIGHFPINPSWSFRQTDSSRECRNRSHASLSTPVCRPTSSRYAGWPRHLSAPAQ